MVSGLAAYAMKRCSMKRKTMNGRILAGLCLFSLFIVVGGDAQSPNIPEKPV